MSFPFTALITHTHPPNLPHAPLIINPNILFQNYPGVHKLLALHIFIIDAVQQVVCFRRPDELVSLPNVTKMVIRWFRSCRQITQPFSLALFAHFPRNNVTRMDDDQYGLSLFLQTKLLLASDVENRSALFPPTPSDHNSKYGHYSGTKEYHFLLVLSGIVSCIRRYQHMNPTQFPFSHCPHCLAHGTAIVESLTHFLFTCSYLLSICIDIFSGYISRLITISAGSIL